MFETAVVAAVQRYLKRLQEHGLSPAFAVVFGSWTKGLPDPWSDIDLVVVAPEFDEGVSFRQLSLLWQVAARVDSRLEPFPCGLREWVEGGDRLIVEVVRREGVRIAA